MSEEKKKDDYDDKSITGISQGEKAGVPDIIVLEDPPKPPVPEETPFKGLGTGAMVRFDSIDKCVGLMETTIEIFDKDGKLKEKTIEVEPVKVSKIHAMRMNLIPMDVIEDVPSQ